MNTQFKKGVLEICVLSKVYTKDMYGYEIVQSISNDIEVNEGTVYPILRRLTKEGYFSTYLQESNEGPPRKYYKITELGKEELFKSLGLWREFSKSVNNIIREVFINE